MTQAAKGQVQPEQHPLNAAILDRLECQFAAQGIRTIRTFDRLFVIERGVYEGVQCSAQPSPSVPGLWRVKLGSAIPSRLFLYHELGHAASGQGVQDIFQMQLASAATGGLVHAGVVLEARAWRWAVKAWAMKHGPLTEREKALIRWAFGSYVTAHQMRFHSSRKGIRCWLPPDGRRWNGELTPTLKEGRK